MSKPCAAPISWLKLELYQLKQVDTTERGRIDEHLATCSACSECLRGLVADDARPLAPLKVLEPAKVIPLRRPVAYVAAVLATAAAVALFVRVEAGRPASGIKGSELAFTLVREDGLPVDGADGVFRDGDAFKALVTCAPPSRLWFDVAVYDAKSVSFPLLAQGDFSCGNSRALPGAFRVAGSEALTVCLVWSDRAIDRSALSQPPTSAAKALCKRLKPAH
jgi:hypothetical protein